MEGRKSKYCCCHPPSGKDWLITMFVKTEEGIKTTTLERRRRLTIASRFSVEGSFGTENLICIWPITETWVTIDTDEESQWIRQKRPPILVKPALNEPSMRHALDWSGLQNMLDSPQYDKKAWSDFFKFCYSPNMFLDNLAYLLWSSGKLANLETQDFPHKGSLQRRDSGRRILNSLSDWELFSTPLPPRKYNSHIFINLLSWKI